MGGDGGWTVKDRVLVVAYTLYLEGMCSCGYPTEICHHPENDGYFDVDTATCYANAAIEAYRNQEGYSPEPGERMGAVYVRDEATDPLPKADGGLD